MNLRIAAPSMRSLRQALLRAACVTRNTARALVWAACAARRIAQARVRIVSALKGVASQIGRAARLPLIVVRPSCVGRTTILLLALVGAVASTETMPLSIPEGLLGAPTQLPAGRAIPAAGLALPGIGQGSVQAAYDPRTWTGDLTRYDAGGTAVWSASAALPAGADRTIYTSHPQPDGTTPTIELREGAIPADLTARLNAAQLNALRTRPLGAIVHSIPAYAGPPAPDIAGQAYFDFLRRHAARPSTIYVAANDGYLHAIDAATGTERWAYLPPAIFNILTTTRQPTRALFDGSPTVADALAGTTWRTVLATGYGMSTRGLFALDVTDPLNFARGGGLLLSFSEADDKAMGHLFTAPAIARFKVGTSGGLPQYRTFIVTTSGINGDDPPALILLPLDKPLRSAWRRNSNYYRLDASSAQAPLTQPALALSPDGSVAYAYVGDLAGNVWRFDFTGRPPWNRNVSRLFTARDASGQRQPITATPAIVHAQGGGYLILFGTGKWLEEQDTDPLTFAPQTLYAVRDSLDKPIHAVGSRNALAARQLRPSGDEFTLSGRPFDPSRAQGWFIDLPSSAQTGERVAAAPQLRDGTVIFSTLLPPADAGQGPQSRVYAIDILSGLLPIVDGQTPHTGQRIDTGTAFPPLIALAGVDGGTANGIGRATAWHTWTFMTPGATSAPARTVRTSLPTQRLTWREIPNWQERHRAALQEEHDP